jgi:hypothetical protein
MIHEKTMTRAQQERFLKIADGVGECFPFLSHIFHDRYCNVVMQYLIDNQITGLEFLKWLKYNCGGNVHVGIRYIAKMHGDRRPNSITDLIAHRKKQL